MVAEVLSRLSTEAKLHLGLSDSLFGVVHGLAPHPDELVLQRVEDELQELVMMILNQSLE